MRKQFQGLKQFLSHPFFAGLLTFLILLKVMTPLVRPTVCSDGWASGSIGRRGACSHHGGVGTNWSLLGVFLGAGGGAYAVGRTLAEFYRRKREALTNLRDAERAAANVQRYSEMPKPQNVPMCPTCGGAMRERLAKRGKNAGKNFWGCGNYPRCRGTRPIA
jgi:Topoisomerase DNA binding C4 zinc finger